MLRVAKLPYLDELSAACAACDRAQSLATDQRNRQVEDAFFRAAVALETFLSEWLIRCLSFDASHLTSRAEKELSQWISKEVGALEGRTARRYRAYLTRRSSTLTIPRRPSLTEALALLGSAGDVVGVGGSKDLEKKSSDNLIHTYAVRAKQLTARERAFLDATKKMRNALAHGSSGAVKAMNDALRSKSLPTTIQRGNYGIARTGIGGYLSAKPGDQRRYAIFLDQHARIADKLCKAQGRPRLIRSAV